MMAELGLVAAVDASRWAATGVGLLAVFVALRSLRIQRRALEDNRRLRIADDVREVLADTFKALYGLRSAVNNAETLAGLSKWRGRLYDELGPVELEEERVASVRRTIDEIERDMEERTRACEAAGSSVSVGGERLRLLLGEDHDLGRIIDPLEVPLFDFMRGLPVRPSDDAVTAFRAELSDCTDYAWHLISELGRVGRAYVSGQQAQPTKRRRLCRRGKR